MLAGLHVRIEWVWSEVTGALDQADVLAVVAPRITPAIMGKLRALRRDHASLPIVLVTAFSGTNVRRINRLRQLDDIIPLEWLAELRAALRAAASRSFLAEAAAWIQSREHIESDLRAALVRACRRRERVHTVISLATHVHGGSRTTLWRAWRKSGLAGTPRAFIDWLLTAHYFAIGAGRVRSAAASLGVDRRTLRRALRGALAGLDPQGARQPHEVLRTALGSVLATRPETKMPDR